MTTRPLQSVVSAATAGKQKLNIAVLFTDREGTAAALHQAEALAGDLDLSITLLIIHVVPFPAQLSDPLVSRRFLEEQARSLAAECQGEVAVRICICREKLDAIRATLPPRSLLVVGARGRWRPNGIKALARALGRDGHQVLSVPVR